MHKALHHVCNGGDSRIKCLPTSYLICNMQEAEIDKPGTCKGDNGRLRRTRVGPGLSQETWQHGSWVSA